MSAAIARGFFPGLVTCLAVASQGFAATPVRGFPVKLEGIADVAPPIVADLDADGKPELIVVTRKQVQALEQDGTVVAGFPVGVERGIATAPTIAILDGSPLILFGDSEGRIMALDGGGKPRAGFPLPLGAKLSTPIGLGDWDKDGRSEIFVGTEDGTLHARHLDGQSLPGFPVKAPAPLSTGVTIARFSPERERVILFGDQDGQMHAWSKPGVEQSGFPYNAKFTVTSQPVLGDLDDDGQFEVVFGSKDYTIHAVKLDGRALPGFPSATQYRIYSTCALADVNGDGVVEALATSGDGKLYALNGRGEPLKGFPVSIGGRLHGSPVAADLDLDGQIEIAVGSDKNQLWLLRDNGKAYAGFPVSLRDAVLVSPLMADLSGTGAGDLVALSRDGSLTAFRLLKKGRGALALAWPAEAHDAGRSGVVFPNPPRYVDLAQSPPAPKTTDALKLSYRFFDMDGDPEPSTLIRWYRNAQRVRELDAKREVPAGVARKHERWHFTLQASEDAKAFQSPALVVLNTPPGPPTIALVPELARTDDDLQMKIVQDAKDVDGDKLRYSIAWLRDRRPEKELSTAVVAAKHTKKGELWTVIVTPNDGEVDGQAARSSIAIANTAPAAGVFRLAPEKPRVTDAVRVEVQKPALDADGDPVRYLYRWSADGKPLNVAEELGVLPAFMVAKHAKIRVEVTAFDGVERGGTSGVTAEIGNSPPEAPAVRIEPPKPLTGDDLSVTIVTPSADPDRDSIRYSFAWRRDGKVQKSEGPLLAAGETRKGQTWSVAVVPNDSEVDGKAGTAEVVIGNTPPSPPVAEAVNPRPTTDQDLQIAIKTPPRDPDDDTAWSEVIWKSDGREVARGRDLFQLRADRTKKHGRYEALLTPTDGTDQGAPVALWFEVENSPPSGCEVVVEPSGAKTGDGLRVVQKTASRDIDGDSVQMRFHWMRDGQPAGSKSEIAPKKVRRGQRWSVMATPFDGEALGPACHASLTVGNRPPAAPAIRILPEKPLTDDDLEVQIERPAADAEGDPIHYLVEWQRKDTAYKGAFLSSPRLPGSEIRKGEEWTVTVVPFDGIERGAAASAKVAIGNTPPSPPEVEAANARPATTEDLVVRIVQPASDPDGDPVAVQVFWSLEREQIRSQKDMFSLPASLTRKHGLYLARLVPSDPQAEGKEARVWFEVQNTPPTRSLVAIDPASPKTGQALTARVTTASKDDDGDTVQVRFRWFRNGEPVEWKGPSELVDGKLVKRGQRWTVVAIPFDGEAEGPPSEATAVVVNQAPSAPVIALDPPKPTTLTGLALRIEKPAEDPDLDPVRLSRRWIVDGKPFAAGEGSGAIPVGALKKGQRWAVEVTACDDELCSPRARAESTVQNSPPAQAQIAIVPERPLSSSELRCVLTTATVDPDGDPVEHSYAWFKGAAPSGNPVFESPVVGNQNTKKGQRWLCQVQAKDGELEGPLATATVTIENGTPTAPVIKIQPERPRAEDGIRCAIETEAKDPDGDKLHYVFQWVKDGVVQSFAPETDSVPPRLTRPDDIWQCIVVAHDDTSGGPPVYSQEVLVLQPVKH